MRHLEFQRLCSAQTEAGGVGTSHVPCHLVTPSEQRPTSFFVHSINICESMLTHNCKL